MVFQKRCFSALAMTTVIAGLLSACGGGGGSGAAVNPAVDISGVASKGLIKKGTVSAYGLNADGTKISTPIATAITDDSGTYTLKGIPAGTSVVIEVTGNVNTKVIDENTGSDYTPADNFTLRAAINTVAGGTNTAIVTPYSEMAVMRAKALTGGLSSTNINLSNQYVAESTGVLVNSAEGAPKFTADGKTPLNGTAAKLVAIAKMTSTSDTSVIACTGKITLSEKTKCVVEELSKEATSGFDENSGLAKTLNEKLARIKTDYANTTAVAATPDIKKVTSTTSATETDTQSPIGQVKAFFASLRSNAKALKDTSGATAPTLYTKLQDIQTDLQTRVSPLNNYASNTITLITKAHGLLQDAKNGSGIYSKRWYKSGYYNNNVFYETAPLGGCSVYTTQDLTTVASKPSEALFVGCHTAGNLFDLYRYNSPITVNGQSQFTRTETVTGITLAPTVGTANSYTVYSRTFRRTVVAKVATNSYPSENDYVEVDKTQRKYLSTADGVSSGYQANVMLTKNGVGDITAINWSGDMASSYDDAGVVLGKKQQLNLNAQLDVVDAHTKKLSMAGDISLINKTNGLLERKLSLDAGSYVIASDNKNGQDEMLLKLSLSSSQWVIQGSLKGWQFAKDKNGLNYDPTQVTFTGSVKDSSGAEFFSGSITGSVSNYANFDKSKPDSSTNFTPVTAHITGSVTIPNRQPLSVDVSVSEATFDSGTGTLTYTQGSAPSITLTVSHSTGSTTNSYSVTNTQGVGMKWSSSDTTASLTKNDVPLGTCDFSTGRLTYIDGTYEQF